MTRKLIIRIFAIVLGLFGIAIIFFVLYPIAVYEWEAPLKFPSLVSPLVTDTKNASSWVENSKKETFTKNPTEFFRLSVPKLKIENAKVAVGGEDLSKSLIQYPGTALPGEVGNSVIFGHSILPFFYDPKNYLAIFSTLNKLDVGDEVSVNYDGITYKYRVEKMFEVRPSDIDILEQDISDSFLTLVTCTPPGDPRKPKRLIVRARLIPPTQAYNGRQ